MASWWEDPSTPPDSAITGPQTPDVRRTPWTTELSQVTVVTPPPTATWDHETSTPAGDTVVPEPHRPSAGFLVTLTR
jgi:hypothetical protein